MNGPPKVSLHGTLDLLILRAAADRARHGYALAAWIEAATGNRLRVEDAALYKALDRLVGGGFLAGSWGRSESNRKARFYQLTPAGRGRLIDLANEWWEYATGVVALLERALPGSPGQNTQPG